MTDLSLKDLRSLDALLSARHVSQAAARMKVSQPAMSMTLKRLRDSFGDPLLVRRGNGLVPTDAGAALHDRVRAVIRDVEDLLERGQGFDPTGTPRTFTLILTDYIDAILVPGLQRHFARIAPEVSLRIVGPNPIRLAQMFGQGEVDLTVSYFPHAPGDLLARRMFTDRMVCVAHRDNPILREPPSLDSFCRLGHVAIEPGEATMYRSVLDEALAARGLERRVVISKPDFMGIPFLLEQSDLIATMPERLATLFAQRFGLVAFPPPLDLPPLDIHMMWHRSTHHSPAHMWLREEVARLCRA